MKLLRVSSPYFVTGLIVENGKVVKAAPIIKYNIGKDLKEILKSPIKRMDGRRM